MIRADSATKGLYFQLCIKEVGVSETGSARTVSAINVRIDDVALLFNFQHWLVN